MSGGRRILVVNPNTSPEVTKAYLAAARAVAPTDVTLDGVTGAFGARIVSNAAENVIAGHAALDLVASSFTDHDAVILAISFDTALAALRPLLPVPVIGITEAALRAAGAGHDRVGIVFFGEVSRTLYTDLITGYGVQPVRFEAVDIASAADYLAPDAKDQAVISASLRLERQGAEAIVICGAAIAGMAERLQPRVPLPLFDGISAVGMALSEIDRPLQRPRHLAPVGETRGLPEALCALLRGARLRQ